MPLYEGIGLISEKHAVVLDIGTSLTKCGYAGEMSPRFVKADPTLDRDGFCTAYINFLDQEDVYIFQERFDGYVFVDNKG